MGAKKAPLLQGHIYCQSQIFELEQRVPLKKNVFSGQIHIKLRL